VPVWAVPESAAREWAVPVLEVLVLEARVSAEPVSVAQESAEPG
jgi:hypothetical protein